MKKQTSFKEDLRRSLINHALIPFVCAVFIVIIVITVIGFYIISRKNIQTGNDFANAYTLWMESYSEEAEEISQRLELERFREDIGYRVAELEMVYHFLNQQDIRGEFYLYDADFQMIFSTDQDTVTAGYLIHYLKSNRSDKEFWKKAEFMYDNWNLQRETPNSCLLFRKIGNEESVQGYAGFVIAAGRFEIDQEDQNLSLIITNRFRRVFTEGAEHFCNDRGKLTEEFETHGLFHMNHSWYYTNASQCMNGDVHIYAVADCTVFLQLILVASVVLLMLSIIMIYFIYVSAGNISARKTDIMYELIGALEEVERGNLEVMLDIQSKDEFERIGSTFNMMLNSIRDLIRREKQLTKENNIATIQTLESQFNPHFLFNTLESVRYMVRVDAMTAEKMIVNLSKLLRYSIQKSEKMVILGEEIEFVDKYLQIMLCRYGERLKYKIDVDEYLYEIEMPKMIIQPIVENSIKYGYGSNKTLEVRISSYVREKGVEILIQDDGIGIPEELLRRIQDSLGHNHNYSGHIGIHNVHRRLHLLYGENYGLTIESSEGAGTTVRLLVPDRDGLGGTLC